MVDIMINSVGSNRDILHRGLIIELIGLAGVGKSTLSRNLRINFPTTIQEFPPSTWKLSCAPFYIKNVLSLTPIITGFTLQNFKGFTRREIAFMALLNGWDEVLRKKTENSDKVIIIDQGAISCMAYLQVRSPYYFQNSNTQKWWLKMYDHWAQTIDMIVWLSAPNSTLIHRIKTRNQVHGLQNISEQNGEATLKRYYLAYESIIKILSMSNKNFHVLMVDSEKNSPEDVVKIVTSEIKSWKPNLF